MKTNLGKLDRILRFALAFWWLGPWAPQYQNELVMIVILVVGWISLVESFVGWCWLHGFFKIDNRDQ
ncbi:MAG: DUF2892 domain-containing protein [Patescibacteria group bacterium]